MWYVVCSRESWPVMNDIKSALNNYSHAATWLKSSGERFLEAPKDIVMQL